MYAFTQMKLESGQKLRCQMRMKGDNTRVAVWTETSQDITDLRFPWINVNALVFFASGVAADNVLLLSIERPNHNKSFVASPLSAPMILMV
jgi:hypothetical protein